MVKEKGQEDNGPQNATQNTTDWHGFHLFPKFHVYTILDHRLLYINQGMGHVCTYPTLDPSHDVNIVS